MTDEELFVAIRDRIEDPMLRIDSKSVGVPPLFGPAEQSSLDAAEAEFGMPFPERLERLYLEVGNGGFGPGAGILGVADGYTDLDGRNLIELYKVLSDQTLPQAVLPVVDLGCAAWSCIDARDANGRVLTLYGGRLTTTKFDLFSWLEAWVTNVKVTNELFEYGERAAINPFNRKPYAMKYIIKPKGEPFVP